MADTNNAAKKKKSGLTRTSHHDAAFERRHMIGGAMSFAASEAYKLLRTNLFFSFSGETDKGRVVGITSAFKGEGKSITALNLAYTIAEAEKKVLFVEADMRLPTMSKRLNLVPTPGLSNLLVGLNSVQDAVQQYAVTPTEGDEPVIMDVIVAGDVPPNPSELLGSKRMRALLTALREYYEFIIIDLPPVTAVADALVVSDMTDGIVVVVRSNRAVRGALQETIRQLRLVDAHILGFVFNGVGEGSGNYYKGYYKKGYGRGYSKYYSGDYYHGYYKKKSGND